MSKIIVVASAALGFMFDDIVRGLQESGHTVTCYTDLAAFQNNPNDLADAEILLAMAHLPCTRDLMLKMPRLRAIVCPYIGTEGFDQKAATDLGIVIAHGRAPELIQSMAEATVMLMLEALYDLRGSEKVLRSNLPRPRPPVARMLHGKTIGLIGFGQIARAVADHLDDWHVNVQTYTPHLRLPLPPGIQRVDLDKLMQTSDIVSIHATLNHESRNLLGPEQLRAMRAGAVLINTARGGIVNEAALIQVARERPDLKIVLDVFEIEPLPLDSPLRDLPNAILTRHMVGHTQESMVALPAIALENIRLALAGEPPLYVRNVEVLPAWKQRFSSAKN